MCDLTIIHSPQSRGHVRDDVYTSGVDAQRRVHESIVRCLAEYDNGNELVRYVCLCVTDVTIRDCA